MNVRAAYSLKEHSCRSIRRRQRILLAARHFPAPRRDAPRLDKVRKDLSIPADTFSLRVY